LEAPEYTAVMTVAASGTVKVAAEPVSGTVPRTAVAVRNCTVPAGVASPGWVTVATSAPPERMREVVLQPLFTVQLWTTSEAAR